MLPPPDQESLFRKLAAEITLEDVAKNRAIGAPSDWPTGYLDAFGLMIELEGLEVITHTDNSVTWLLTDFGKEVIPFLYQE